MALVDIIVKEALWADKYFALQAVKYLFKSLVHTALIFVLENGTSNHLLLKLAKMNEVAVILAAFRTARWIAAEFTQAVGADNARALRANFDRKLVWSHWQPANETFYKVVIAFISLRK